MTATNLRALAKDYANGVIDREKYRKARAELIEGILAGDIKVESREFIAPVEAGDDTDITQEKTALRTEPDAFRSTGEFEGPPTVTARKPARKQPGKSSQKWIIGSAIVIIICSVVIVTLLLQGEEEPEPVVFEAIPPEPEVAAPDTAMIEPAAEKPDAGITLIEQFLDSKNWQTNSIEQFSAEWQKLSDAEQQAAISSPALTQLNNAIYQQLLKERALVGLAEPEKINARQEILVGLAKTVGIYDDRLTVQKVRFPATSEVTPKQTSVDEQSIAEEKPATATPENEQAATAEDTTPDVPQQTDPAPTETGTTSFAKEQTVEEAPAPVAETGEPEIIAAAKTAEPDTASESTETPRATAPEPAQKESTTNCKPALARQRRPYCRDTIPDVGKAPTMVVLPAGKFMMGGEKPEELPLHEVTISAPFAISVNEITQGEFELFCTDTGRTCPRQPWSGKDYPVVNVTWNDAVAYTQWQSEKTGNTYRLPTEAEWEYAARGGTTTPYPFGEEVLITDAVFSDVKQLNSPLPKSDRSINRNEFRLYHMVGNVREWVLDPWHDNYNGAPADGSVYGGSGINTRVVRGGSYADPAEALRSAARLSLGADKADNQTGFRILQELQ
ncbi:MAG TPA: SUMF1/EgtB/PvdO family nonheme iron enzyme [Gammaproteobacteria bacterium]|nr:SUMF1/EgtB/PvdO family nonheme iron enzyme [Gammaproteobacteria bacterium]